MPHGAMHRWVVPVTWAPVTASLLVRSVTLWRHALLAAAALIVAGLLLWQLLEYSLHRLLFHATPRSYWGITLHFLFHGCHHKFPRDQLRLVFPPLPAMAIASCIWGGLRACMAEVRHLKRTCASA